MKLCNEKIKAYAGIVSSLEKILPDQHEYPELGRLDAIRGERTHFQVAFYSKGPQYVSLMIRGPLARYASTYSVVYVPCINPAEYGDTNVMTSKAGIFPGPLIPEDTLWCEPDRTAVFWVTLDLPRNVRAGESELEIELQMKPSWKAQYPPITIPLNVKVYDFSLPPQKLACEMWFHGDCLLNQYNVKVWSKEYWKILENYFRDMTKHGLNVLLTPLWSLPLDTGVGLERPTVQLLLVTKREDGFHFDFRRLKKWIDTAKKCGIQKFSFSHLYTQWGLEKTPKIMVREHRREKQMFGWDVASDSPEYKQFLTQLFAALLPFLRKNGLTPGNTYFHISDEPDQKHVAKYKECSLFIHSLLNGYRTLDALSDTDFYDQGLVDCPVPRSTMLESFMERSIPERWFYYCSDWENNVPNRKPGMASIRNRIQGLIMYLYRIDGFLEWGYNFWFSCLSWDQHLNPFDIRHINRIYGNNGGAFVVFPGEDGKPVSTLYYEVFADGLQDMRLLQLLESKIGREAVVAMIQEGLPKPLTIHEWPDDPAWLLELHHRISDKLETL